MSRPQGRRRRRFRLSPVREEGSSPREIFDVSTLLSDVEDDDDADDDIDDEAILNAKLAALQAETRITGNRSFAPPDNKKCRDALTGVVQQIFTSSGSHDDFKLGVRAFEREYKKVLSVEQLRLPFFNELDVRLSFIVEDGSNFREQRRFVLEVVANFAASVLHSSGDVSVVEFLCEFCETWSAFSLADARVNIAVLIAFVFRSCLRESRGGDSELLPNRQLRRFVDVLKMLIQDKNPATRVETIAAFGVIQNVELDADFLGEDERNPKEIVMKSLLDYSHLCRMAAVQLFSVTSKEQADFLRKLALCDNNTKVRCLAIEKFGDVNFKMTSNVERFDFLFTLLKDYDPAIREAAKKFIIQKYLTILADKRKKVMRRINKGEVVAVDSQGEVLDSDEEMLNQNPLFSTASMMLLNMLPPAITAQEYTDLKSVFFEVIDTLRRLYKTSTKEMDAFIEELCNDVSPSPPNLLTRKTATELLTVPANTSEQLMYTTCWRFMVEFAVERAPRKCDHENTIDRLAPGLPHTLQIANSLLDAWKEKEEKEPADEEENHLQEHTLYNLLLILKHLERDKNTELRKEWRMLLEKILLRQPMKLLTDVVMEDLGRIHEGCPRTLLNVIADVMLSYAPDTADETISLAISGSNGHVVQSEDADIYELQLLHGALKTGLFSDLSDEIIERLNKIRQFLSHKKVECRVWAIQCFAMIGVFGREACHGLYEIVHKRLHHDVLLVKLACIDFMVEMIGKHGYKVINAQFSQVFKRDSKSTGATELMDEFSGIMLEESVEEALCLKTCEGAGKILLNEIGIDFTQKSWAKVLMAFFYRMTITSDRIRSAIGSFLKIFGSLSAHNQRGILDIFNDFFSEAEYEHDTIVKHMSHEKLSRIAPLFAVLTRHSLLPKKERQSNTPCHVELLRKAFQELYMKIESIQARYYCHILDFVELESIEPIKILEFIDQTNNLIEMNETISDQKTQVVELRRFLRRMKKNVAEGDNAEEYEEEEEFQLKQEPEDEIEKTATAPQKSTRTPQSRLITPKKGMSAARRGKNSTKIPATPLSVVHEIHELVTSPSVTASTKKRNAKMVIKSSETRSHLNRSTKKKN
ncbi:unnamed protein product [Caenorhabditis auriculariae]|uniref:Nuclear condensin complex subunit 3 C-terminal domain-containing protein n=1 Tax=Caenorhabditis auriculariae TaxID=2777116 RepID=A0A8S1HV81_9PELO|nr:unnamed protein product [Caenorhabditis auriculariae]